MFYLVGRSITTRDGVIIRDGKKYFSDEGDHILYRPCCSLYRKERIYKEAIDADQEYFCVRASFILLTFIFLLVFIFYQSINLQLDWQTSPKESTLSKAKSLGQLTSDPCHIQWAIKNLQKGDHGDEVLLLQSMLGDSYFESLPNGMYDNATISAVISFQRKNRLPSNGEFGQSDWLHLIRQYNCN